MRRVALLLSLGLVAAAQLTHGGFAANLAALKCDTALVFRTDRIRDPLGWTLDNKSVVVKFDGQYQRIELDALQLKKFKWRDGQDIAGPLRRPVLHPLTAAERSQVVFGDETHSREVTTRRGVKVELAELDEGGVALRITKSREGTREIWRTRMEDCQGLVPSPDQRWVAFIAGHHGVVVLKLPD